MPKPIARFLVLIVELLVLPPALVSYGLFVVGFAVRFRAERPPITAYSLLYGRWVFDRTGRRPDPACRQLFASLPGVLTWLANLIAAPAMWAIRVTGATLFGWLEYPVYRSTTMVNYLGQRTRFLDDALYRALESVEQVVILGAGWDTRAYNLNHKTDVQVYEVDLVQMQRIKRKALARAGIDLSGAVYCSADLNQEPWLDALKRVGFDPDAPAFVLWEGVTYYLSPAAVKATLQTVATQLAPGSAIAFDYFSRHYVEGGELSLLPRPLGSFFRLIGEPHVFGLPTEPPAEERLAAFLRGNGLTLAAYEPIGANSKHPAGDEQRGADGGLVLATNG